MKTIKPVFKCHGEKASLIQWIISHLPENYEEMTYVEPFCGGANIFLNKNKSKVEIINDIDVNVTKTYQALRDEPKEFIRRLNLCKYCEETFLRAEKKTQFNDYLDEAINEFILRKMSRGELKKIFTTKQTDCEWENTVKALPELSSRLHGVYVLNKQALDVMKAFDSEDTVFYCNPPYLHEAKISKTVYSSEMPTENHIELAHALNNMSGKIMISGLSSPLYNRLYKGWNVDKKKISSDVEFLWKNF